MNSWRSGEIVQLGTRKPAHWFRTIRLDVPTDTSNIPITPRVGQQTGLRQWAN